MVLTNMAEKARKTKKKKKKKNDNENVQIGNSNYDNDAIEVNDYDDERYRQSPIVQMIEKHEDFLLSIVLTAYSAKIYQSIHLRSTFALLRQITKGIQRPPSRPPEPHSSLT